MSVKLRSQRDYDEEVRRLKDAYGRGYITKREYEQHLAFAAVKHGKPIPKD